MKFYLTAEPASKIRQVFINLNQFYIIDIPDILKHLNIDRMNPVNIFLINAHIMGMIDQQSRSKRLQGIIYSNPGINDEIIDSLYVKLKDNTNIDGLVLMDDMYVPKLKKYHKLFEEIMFFPTVKRIKIIECRTIPGFDDSSINIES